MVGFFRGDGLRAPLCTQGVAPRLQKHTGNRRVAPGPTGSYFPAGRWAATSPARAGVRPRSQRLPAAAAQRGKGRQPRRSHHKPPVPAVGEALVGLSCASPRAVAMGQPGRLCVPR